jgi:starch phosphorylase
LYTVAGTTGGRVPVILLDTDLDANQPGDRAITYYLYGGDEAYRLKQEIVLGIGGARMLDALGFRVRQYHMNEGHSALLVLHLLRRFAYADQDLRAGDAPYDVPRVRSLCNFTTHTPVEAGHDRFGYDLVQRVLGEFVDATACRQAAERSVSVDVHLSLHEPFDKRIQ